MVVAAPAVSWLESLVRPRFVNLVDPSYVAQFWAKFSRSPCLASLPAFFVTPLGGPLRRLFKVGAAKQEGPGLPFFCGPGDDGLREVCGVSWSGPHQGLEARTFLGLGGRKIVQHQCDIMLYSAMEHVIAHYTSIEQNPAVQPNTRASDTVPTP